MIAAGSVRRMRAGDIEPVRNLVCALASFYVGDPAAELPAWLADSLTVESFRKRFESDEFQVWVYEVATDAGSTVVGYLALRGESHLFHLFVDAEYQKQGIASELWQQLRTDSALSACTVRSSLYAVPVYRKLGFQEYGPVMEKEGLQFQPMQLAGVSSQ